MNCDHCVSFRAAADFTFVTLPDWEATSGTEYGRSGSYFDIDTFFTVGYGIQSLINNLFCIFLEYATKCFQDRNSDLVCDWTRSQLSPSPTGKDRRTAGTVAQRQNVQVGFKLSSLGTLR